MIIINVMNYMKSFTVAKKMHKLLHTLIIKNEVVFVLFIFISHFCFDLFLFHYKQHKL